MCLIGIVKGNDPPLQLIADVAVKKFPRGERCTTGDHGVRSGSADLKGGLSCNADLRTDRIQIALRLNVHGESNGVGKSRLRRCGAGAELVTEFRDVEILGE